MQKRKDLQSLSAWLGITEPGGQALTENGINIIIWFNLSHTLIPEGLAVGFFVTGALVLVVVGAFIVVVGVGFGTGNGLGACAVEV